MLISEEYRALNATLHESDPDYGKSGHKWAEMIAHVAKKLEVDTILDYGAGKGTLKTAIGGEYNVREYDPAVPSMAKRPEPAQLVTCTDVLEHIEPHCLHDVLDDLQRLGTLGAFVVIATRPAKKILADGRNAHLIVEPPEWWIPKLLIRWRILMIAFNGSPLYAMMRRK